MNINQLFTIIIPHYNIPDLLMRCLESIPVSEDIQVIVVDDNSPDADTYLEKYPELSRQYLELIRAPKNGGAGYARNVGLDHAKGKYVLFADADDFFNDGITDILDEYSNTPYDIVFFNANVVDTDTLLPTNRGTTLREVIKEYNKHHDVRVFQYLFGEPWCKLVRRDIIMNHHIRFDEIKIHNDTKYSYLVGYYAHHVKFDNRALYSVTNRAGSVSKMLTDENWGVRTRVFAEKNRFLADHGIPFFDKLMITPFFYYLHQRDWKSFNRCLSMAAEYGFSAFFVISKMLYYKFSDFIKR